MVEVPANGIDDNCDGRVDDRLQQAGKKMLRLLFFLQLVKGFFT